MKTPPFVFTLLCIVMLQPAIIRAAGSKSPKRTAVTPKSPSPSPAPLTAEVILAEIEAARSRIREFRSQIKRSLEENRSQALVTRSAIQQIEKYTALIRVRYADEEGDFEPAYELRLNDRENITRLVGSYLKEKLPSGRLSAGAAIRLLEDARKRLRIRAEIQENPSESNHSETEILSARIQEQEDLIEERTRFAKSQGLKL